MDIHLQSLHFKASEKLQAYVQEKVSKLTRVNQHIIRAEVTLSEGQDGANPFQCEIRLVVPGNDHIVKRSADTYEKAVHGAVNVLLRRLRDQKRR